MTRTVEYLTAVTPSLRVVSVSSRVRGRFDPSGEPDDAKRVMKQVTAGMRGAGDLSPREFGLLYLYYPNLLPDVEVSGDE